MSSTPQISSSPRKPSLTFEGGVKAGGHALASAIYGLVITILFGWAIAIYDGYTYSKDVAYSDSSEVKEKEYALLPMLDQWFGPTAWKRVSEIGYGKRGVFDFTAKE